RLDPLHKLTNKTGQKKTPQNNCKNYAHCHEPLEIFRLRFLRDIATKVSAISSVSAIFPRNSGSVYHG
ncbi:MAG TPA: hypothetical protein VFA77_15560, partial [Candidatus Eisenbacteria bacterium]|nr:hypothetical protein [Candidatus Eisenbacteria bacterium]